MLQALATVFRETWDPFLKLNARDPRKRRLAKPLYDIYTGLGLTAGGLEGFHRDLGRYARGTEYEKVIGDLRLPEGLVLHRALADGRIELCLRQVDFEGQMTLSTPKVMERREVLALAIRRHISDLARGFELYGGPLERLAMDWYQVVHMPDRAKEVGLPERRVIETFIKGWYRDGGFVQAMRGLRIEADFSQNQVVVVDAVFNPESARYGSDAETTLATFELGAPEHVDSFLAHIQYAYGPVKEAREQLREFMSATFKLADVI